MASLDYFEDEEYPPDLSEDRLISLVSQIKVSYFLLIPFAHADPPRSQLTISTINRTGKSTMAHC